MNAETRTLTVDNARFKGMLRKLNQAEKEGWMEYRARRAACASPDLNNNDLRFFASSKSRVWRERYSRIDDLEKGVKAICEEYDADT